MSSNGPCQFGPCCVEADVYRKPLGGETVLGYCHRHDPLKNPAMDGLWAPGRYRPNDTLPPRREVSL